jgi:hypothetical protein
LIVRHARTTVRTLLKTEAENGHDKDLNEECDQEIHVRKGIAFVRP